jgi:hypothetical protein
MYHTLLVLGFFFFTSTVRDQSQDSSQKEIPFSDAALTSNTVHSDAPTPSAHRATLDAAPDEIVSESDDSLVNPCITLLYNTLKSVATWVHWRVTPRSFVRSPISACI